MKSLFSIIILLSFAKFTLGQDSLLTYSKILKADSFSKMELFDKALIWCSKAFTDSKSAINIKERESGIIGGKAFYFSIYKVPKKKDSVAGVFFSNYYFDWLIEVKEGKLRFSAKNIYLKEFDKEYIVSTKAQAPFEVWLQPKSKLDLEWRLSREYFIGNLDKLTESLNDDLHSKKTDW
jgi:hypothetical protein